VAGVSLGRADAECSKEVLAVAGCLGWQLCVFCCCKQGCVVVIVFGGELQCGELQGRSSKKGGSGMHGVFMAWFAGVCWHRRSDKQRRAAYVGRAQSTGSYQGIECACFALVRLSKLCIIQVCLHGCLYVCVLICQPLLVVLIIIIMLPNQAIASTPSAPRPITCCAVACDAMQGCSC
jgi:hypothetical protein